MSNTKKTFIMLAIDVIAAIILFSLLMLFIKNTYNLEKVSSMISSSTLPENVHIKNEIVSDESTQYVDYYIKDDNTYVCQKDNSLTIAETLQNTETSEQIIILHKDKVITKSSNETDMEIPLKETFSILSEKAKESKNSVVYKYCGKENIEGKECIKVSFEEKLTDKVEITYFYIDLEKNYIIKYEYYEGSNEKELNKIQTETYSYEENSVTDNDILKFDINNYPDYQYIGE